jgi:hypothetical protein
MLFSEKRDPDQSNNLKEAFAKVKNDIFSLGNEILDIKKEFLDLKNQLNMINNTLNNLSLDVIDLKNSSKFLRENKAIPTDIPTNDFKRPTIPSIPSDNPTVPCEIGGSKYPNLDISSGNRGVPTDRQTDQQTDNYDSFPLSRSRDNRPISLNRQLNDASQILDSLDSIKKEIRLKFKQMTNQEMLVFSTIYQLEEHFPEGIEYRQIALKLKLSESSIRDYVQKLISKGIPIDKIKLNNKKIMLKIPLKLRNLATLDAIIRLREI